MVALAEGLLGAMRDGDWKKAVALQQERDKELRLFCERTDVGEAHELSSLLQEMRAVNDEAQHLGDWARVRLLKEMDTFKQNRRGHLAYQRRGAA